jgi:putative RecB family exonuclease
MSHMFDVPTSLSPSRVEGFLSCPLQFRFASIERLPEPPSIHTTRGSMVHRALELLFTAPAGERTPDRLAAALDTMFAEYRTDPELVDLHLTDEELAELEGECRDLAANYLRMEDPATIREIGLELRLEAAVDGLTLRGIIDRLELDEDGELVVTDYKTGRAPSLNWEQKSLAGVHFYSFLCTEVLGRRPRAIRLMYLRSGETITATPSEQSVRFLTTRTRAVWKAIERACVTGDFRPRPGALCSGCAFQAWCPAFGGDPDRAAHEAPVRVASLALT